MSALRLRPSAAQHCATGQWLGFLLAVVGLILPSSISRAATITVTDLTQKISSTGGCSLPEAIYSANFDRNIAIDTTDPDHFITTNCTPGSGDDTIVLPSGMVFQGTGIVDDAHNALGPTATPIIFSNIAIDANGSRLERTGSVNVRAFAVGSASVDLPNLNGPAKTVSGTGELTLNNAYLIGFNSKGGDGGGVGSGEFGGGGGGGMGAGGAVYLKDGELTVMNSTFEGNSATGGNGAVVVGSGSSLSPGGGGGGLNGSGGRGSSGGGGGGGARGKGGLGSGGFGGGGGGTVEDGAVGGSTHGGSGGFLCGANGGNSDDDGLDGYCPGGGGGGGGQSDPAGLTSGGAGGKGNYGGGGGGGGDGDGNNGGDGGFGGGGGGEGGFGTFFPGNGGNGGFGGGGGGAIGLPGYGGPFGGNASPANGGGGAGLGGAIFNDGGILSVFNCTFTGNTAFGGAGGDSPTTITAENGDGQGNAIFSRNGTTNIIHVTVSGNGGGADIVDVAIVADGGSAGVSIINSILADNPAGAPNGQVFTFSGGSVSQNNSGNLIEVSGVSSASTGPFTGAVSSADPGLQPLALNPPGNTPTMAISKTSSAYQHADATKCQATDQRGVSRKSPCDIGAYENNDFPQGGATLLVTTTADHDDGLCGTIDCTLREAIATANHTSGPNIINFAANVTGTITLQSGAPPFQGTLTVTDSVTITGPGASALAVSGNSAIRVFSFSSGSNAISGLTIRDGAVTGAPGSGGVAAGGGVFNAQNASLTLSDCTFSGNHVQGADNATAASAGGSGSGGAIANSGVITLNRCTFSGNSALGGRGGDGSGALGGNVQVYETPDWAMRSPS